MTIFLTGATGFIGSYLAEALLSQGHSLRCLVRDRLHLRWLEEVRGKVETPSSQAHPPSLELVEGDLSHRGALQEQVQGCDLILHNAGLVRALYPEEYYRINTQGTHRLLEAAARVKNPRPKQFILVSSLAACGPRPRREVVTETSVERPVTPYGQSKLYAERTAKSYASFLPVTLIRPPIVLGPRDEATQTLFRIAQSGIKWTLGKKWLSFIYVKDLVRGILLTLNNPRAFNQTYFIASPEFITQDALIQKIAGKVGQKTKTVYLPSPLILHLASCVELLARFQKKPSLLNRFKAKEATAPSWLCSSEKAGRELGFSADYSLDRALEETIEWLRQQKGMETKGD